MKLDLIDLLRQDTVVQQQCESYGVDPTRVEEYLASKPLHYRDDTADIAVANADRELARRRKAKR